MIQVRNVSKTYLQGKQEIQALHNISFGMEKGEFVSIMGPSGSGKSTLLNLIGGIDQPSAGEIFIDGSPLHGISDDELTLIRRRKVGFIFQFFNLLPILTAEENVGLPLLLDGVPFSRIKEKACRLLENVGLGLRTDHRPEQLSGGEMQRVAIARALITDPAVLLADEPTGNLDSHISEEILELLKNLNQAGQTIVMVTHDARAASFGKRIIRLKDGGITEDVSVPGCDV
ncbi:MAG: ABC transporter ATP-binding protein [Deltaproteobacteria bacterium]|nr:ABC transporter ATP-binding protein [Deltaproteobacteria bacterium]